MRHGLFVVVWSFVVVVAPPYRFNVPSRDTSFPHPTAYTHAHPNGLAQRPAPGEPSFPQRHTDIPKMCTAAQLPLPALARLVRPKVPRGRLTQRHA